MTTAMTWRVALVARVRLLTTDVMARRIDATTTMTCRSLATTTTTTSSSQQHDDYELLILGGGTAGSSIAHKLCKKLGRGKVGVIEPNERHYYQALFTLVGMGLKPFERTYKRTKDVLPKSCDWLKTKVCTISPEENQVRTVDGRTLTYKYLVVALGLQTNFHLVKGLVEALENDPMVCSNYDPKYVLKTFEAAKAFTKGNAIFTFPNTPIKCAGAPQKICYLTEDYFRRMGKRDNATIIYNTPLGVVFGVQKYAQTLHDEIVSRDIKLNLKRDLIEVKSATKEVVFNIIGGEGETETYTYSMLHVSPPCSAPEILWDNPISDKAGFVDVDKHTCQHVRYPNIFSLGDCSNLPTSKTAAAVSSQAGVVGHNLLMVMKGTKPDRLYNGYTSCPLVTKKGWCILAEFGYDGKIMETFPFNQAIPRRSSFYMKALAMPLIYWLMLVKGYWNGPATIRKWLHLGMAR